MAAYSYLIKNHCTVLLYDGGIFGYWHPDDNFVSRHLLVFCAIWHFMLNKPNELCFKPERIEGDDCACVCILPIRSFLSKSSLICKICEPFSTWGKWFKRVWCKLFMKIDLDRLQPYCLKFRFIYKDCNRSDSFESKCTCQSMWDGSLFIF